MTPITSENVISAKPKIKRYSNILKYLKDFYEYKKALDAKFTYDIWSAELGFRSRSFMYLICSGRRPLTVKFIDKLAHYLEFNFAEKNHLILLSSYHRTKSTDLKAIFLDKILENLDSNENTLDTRNYSSFISSPTMPLIKMILSFDDIKGTFDEISSLLKVDARTIKKDLLVLEKMGLVKRTYTESSREIIWKATSKSFKVTGLTSREIMDFFHHRTAIEAAEISKHSEVFKKFRSILFAINPGDHELLLSEIEHFLSKMKNRFGYNEISGKHIVKLNLQAYPVTEISE